MNRLLLLRHAKSSWDEPGLADHERPLAPRGRRASALIAKHLESEGLTADLVLCSSSRRTRETLELILPSLGTETRVVIDGDIFAASSSQLMAIIRRLEDDVGSAMLIGHNPGIQELAVTLAGRGDGVERLREKFPTAGLATLELDAGWSGLAPGCARLIGFVRPRELE